MDCKNGYKVVYERYRDYIRSFYAAKSNTYPTRDDDGNISDDRIFLVSDEELTFTPGFFRGKTVYEHKGKLYVSGGRLPAYDTDGNPASTETELKGFNTVFVETEEEPGTYGRRVNEEVPEENEANTAPEEDEDETTMNPEPEEDETTADPEENETGEE